MKRRTAFTIIVVLSLLLVGTIPARASTGAVNRITHIGAPARFNQSGKANVADIFNTLPEGFHDNFGGSQNQFFCRAEGWAADPDDRSLHLNIKIFSDGVEVAQTIADTFRPDLAGAEVCAGGTCSFSVDLWDLISHDADHLITVQAQDAQTGEWSNLYNTPKTLNCFEAQAQTFIVNNTGDLGDVIQGNGVCETSTPGECTLRAAIMESNANPGADTIRFNIPGAGPFTISPSYGFDFIFDPVTIDATTQPGFPGTPIIELDGSNAGPDAYGIVIFAGSSTVRGLAINRFALTGVDINVNGGNTIQGNYIGTDLTGIVDLGNGVNGIAIQTGSGSNLIGGTTAGAGNIISGNNEFGIIIVDPGSNGNMIQGNLIGTDVTGSIALGNHIIGIVIGAGASDNVIGGEETGSRNIISGNDHNGIQIDTVTSTGNLIQGNYIGTDVTGTISLGNADDGVLLLAPNNTIGGTATAARNIISGNQEQGIRIAGSDATGNVVQGNFIGTDVTGSVALGNGTDCCHSGIVLHLGASNNFIGGNTPGAGNVISGNTADGVTIIDAGTTGNLVAGNMIGTDMTGTKNVANSFSGITIFDGASDNMIGGTTSSTGNTIAFNNDNGVVLAMSGVAHNGILSNSIYSNGSLGIDLGQDGVSLNDLFDADSGPNNLQNFPLLNSIKSTSKGTLIQGALLSTRNTTFRLEFFSSPVCDLSGYGEGQTYLGFVNVKTNSTGHVNFNITLPASLTKGAFITATATDPTNNTSEFSKCVKVTP